MHSPKGKTPLSLLLGIALSFSLLTAPVAPSTALSFNSAPARIWGTLFASEYKEEDFQTEGSDTATSGIDESQARPAKSSFEITYVNIPDRAKAAIAKGVRAWEGSFESKVPVKVAAYWDRTAPFGVLGTARPGRYFNDFENAPDPELWYASALANAIAGKDLDPANPEILIRISAFTFWYYGLDGRPGEKQFDLASVVLHEIGHGVGFLSNADYLEYNSFGTISQPTPFDAYAQLPDGRRLMDVSSPSLELGTAITAPLNWSGRKAIVANGGVAKPLLFTPPTYENGSSVSHLDEESYPPGSINAAMTPRLADSEVLTTPGPLAEAMIQDMMAKPPVGPAFGLPSEPRNVTALVGDGRAIVTFDPPANARSAQVSSYTITNVESGERIEAEKSPVVMSGLRNGRTYTFEIMAHNENGKSPKVRSNVVTPERGWSANVIDPEADAKFIAVAKFQGRDVIAYTDSKRGDVKLASYVNGRWIRTVIDGNSTRFGRTKDDVSGYLSLCVSGSSSRERLHLFYTDLKNNDLRYGEFDGRQWKFEIVDGNGPKVQNYEEPARVRTASNVSVSNACAATSQGLQVFYRDEDQGILLGAVRSRNQWFYEIVDGDKKTGGRTVGDVGFRLRSVTVNDIVYLIYDSILVVDQNRDATQGEVRVATRSTIYPEDWSYRNLETTGELVAVPGYDISIVAEKRKVFGSWLSSTPLTRPTPDRIKSRLISGLDAPIAGFADDHGSISGPLSEDSISALFGCQSRLCVMEKSSQEVSLIVDKEIPKSALAAWIKIGKTRFAVVGVDGKLTLFRP